MTRDGAVAARVAHNHEVAGSSPAPATMKRTSACLGSFSCIVTEAMERDAIREEVARLPLSPLGVEARDEEIWEANDGRAHFKITRHILPVPDLKVEIMVLSVSGLLSERTRVIGEFREALGEPDQQELNPNPEGIDFVTWLIKASS